jgi:alpha-tubulin suppressor-like RCC1 family protein
MALLSTKFKIFSLLVTFFLSGFLIGCGGGGSRGSSSSDLPVIAAISAGDSCSFALDSDGKVYATGINYDGQLGLNDTNDRNSFTEVTSLSGVIAISIGFSHSLALTKNNKVYATGSNQYGQLGLSDTNNHNSFTAISSLNDKTVTAIATGEDYSFVLAKDGKIYAIGWNRFGQLGLGDTNDRNTFTVVSSLSNITAIVAGYKHSLALADNGTVYATGHNYNGQLGLSNNNDYNNFTVVSSLSGKIIIAIVTGDSYSLALDNDGKVYATGHNYNGQLGLGDTNDRNTFIAVPSLSGKTITAIAAGGHHSFALDSNGKVYATGYNYYGQLGLGNTNDRNTFIAVPSLSGIATIAAGYRNSFAIDGDGKVYATGWNYFGELGLNDDIDRKTFTEVKFDSAITH